MKDKLREQEMALIANLAAVVRVQNGNRHEDINKLLAHADELLSILDADGGSVSEAQIMAEWFKADGSVHGPNVETVTMPQAKYLAFRRSITHPHSPDAADSGRVGDESALVLGGRYNWKNQPERLVFIGRNWSGNGYWNQFEKVGEPGKVWCEVLDSDLDMIEKTTAALAAQGQGEAVRQMRRPGQELWQDTTASQQPIAREMGYEIRTLYTHPAPPASPAGVPDGWMLRETNGGIVMKHARWGNYAVWSQVDKPFFEFLNDLLAAAPSATSEGGEVGL